MINTYKMSVLRITLILFTSLLQVRCQREQGFTPAVTSECRNNVMEVRVRTLKPFNGTIHVTNNRKKGCQAEGTGQKETILRLDLTDPVNYCGIYVNKNNGLRSARISVRVHKTLELADDKHYNVTCQSRARSFGNGSSIISLNFIDEGEKVTELTFGRTYTLRAVAAKPTNFGLNYGMKVVSCMSFGGAGDGDAELIDSRGCPTSEDISKFDFDSVSGSAEATLFRMFKFPNSNQVHIQCEVLLCRGTCLESRCDGDSLQTYPRALAIQNEYDEKGMASTSAFVLEPGEQPLAEASSDCSNERYDWLLGLTITFGILFLIMFILNILLCVLMTCTCTKTEVIEKEPSEIDDYDPYKVGWVPSTGHQSQYGSRYSLNAKPGYTSGASTINSTTRSLSTNSDHYAIVHSRPNSRYSHHSTSQLKTNGKGPASIMSNGHYSSRI